MSTSRKTIIVQIQRLAKEIGRSPGKTIFQDRTGIPESHWYGTYWLSWGEALREAGLSANAVPAKIVRAELLSAFAKSVRHFGEIPSVAQLRMYARVNPGFPSQSTFNKTFGDKKGLLAALVAFARDGREFLDIVQLLPEPGEISQDDTHSSSGDGYVYLLKSGGNYKIGRSDEIERRVKQIKVALPEAVTLEHAIRTDDPPGIEAYWHRRFAERRANGEWFRLATTDVRAFKRRRFQ